MTPRSSTKSSGNGLLLLAVVAAAAVVAFNGLTPGADDSAGPGALTTVEDPATDEEVAAALADLGTVTTTPGRPDVAGYERDCGSAGACSFGQDWADVDANGCDTRIICTPGC